MAQPARREGTRDRRRHRRPQARAQRDRHLRTWTRGVETHGHFSGPTTTVARLLDTLELLRKAAFDRARGAGERESQDASRFDALIALAERHGSKSEGADGPDADAA
jgi:hypothetical protein